MTEAGSAHGLSKGYVRYCLFLLLLVNTINYMDRQLINILAEPIKAELGLSDWALGLMNGLAFATLYTALGLPLARLAERRNRSFIIAASISVWSGFTALSGMAATFTQLVLARIGVGVGEAGCTPAATSLIADYVPRERRASAMAFYTMAAPLGGVVGLGLGGLIADQYGWRAAFLIVGLPGIPLGILTALTLAEPRRRLEASAGHVKQVIASFGETLTLLRGNRTFWLVTAATCGKVFIGYGHAAFTASFLVRNHGPALERMAAAFDLQTIGFLGLLLGLTTGPANMLGAYIGGMLADRFGMRNIAAYATVPAVASLLQLPFALPALLVGDTALAIGLLVVNGLLASIYYGPVYATMQSIVPPHMRATTVAIFVLITTLVGLGIGPLAVGGVSDLLAGPGGMGTAEGLRWSLVLSLAVYPVIFILFWRARQTIAADIAE